MSHVHPSGWPGMFRDLAQDTRIPNGDDLRRAAIVMETTGLDPTGLMAQGPDQIEVWMRDVKIRAPGTRARRLAQTMNIAARLRPDLALPITPEVKRLHNVLTPLDDEPRRLLDDIAAALASTAVQYAGTVATAPAWTGEALPARQQDKARAPRELLQALRRRSMPVPRTFGLKDLIDPITLRAAVCQLESDGYRPSFIYKIAAGCVSIAADLYGEDDDKVTAARNELIGRAPSHVVDADYCQRLIGVLLIDGAQAILDAPCLILERLGQPGAGPATTRRLHALALTWDLKLNHPSLAPSAVSQLRVGEDGSFPVIDGIAHFEFGTGKRKAGVVKEPMASSSVKLLSEFNDVYKRSNSSTLLFPRRDGEPQHFNKIMTCLYEEVELAIGLKLTFKFLEDLSAAASLYQEEEETLFKTSQALRLSQTSILSVRLRTLLRCLKQTK